MNRSASARQPGFRPQLPRLLPLLLLLLASLPAPAEPAVFESGETPATLVELFSSEGCSSCPPAEAWIASLKARGDLWKNVVPIVFHVDYWDNLGWPDRFASRQSTERQRNYSKAWRSNSVYTPGFVVNGLEWKGWFDHKELPSPDTRKTGKLRLSLSDASHAEVVFTPVQAAQGQLLIEVALLGDGISNDVKRGENAGRKLLHDFVVLRLASAAAIPRNGRFTASIPLDGKLSATPGAIASWVSAGAAEPPLQAIGGWLVNK